MFVEIGVLQALTKCPVCTASYGEQCEFPNYNYPGWRAHTRRMNTYRALIGLDPIQVVAGYCGSEGLPSNERLFQRRRRLPAGSSGKNSGDSRKSLAIPPRPDVYLRRC